MTLLELASAVLGSLFAVSSVLVDLVANAKFSSVQSKLELLSRPFRIRGDVPAHDNLRQVLAVAGSLLLLALAMASDSPVYFALEILMLLSKLIWFVAFSADPIVSDKRKAVLRLIAAVLVWVALEALELCPGFHRLGVLGLELLGCAYAIQGAALRHRLMVFGSGSLVAYAAIGVLLEPERFTIHTTQLFLNGIFLAVALLNLKTYESGRGR